MLPTARRLRRSADFGRTVRKGARAGRSTMVVHRLSDEESSAPAMVGFVVSKAVGNAVHRNQVKRRLRYAMAERVATLPGGTTVVVRALPAAATSSYPDLVRDLDVCLGRVARPGSVSRGRERA